MPHYEAFFVCEFKPELFQLCNYHTKMYENISA